jgi:hypothetical protein
MLTRRLLEIYEENLNHLIIRWKRKVVRTIKLIIVRSVDITMISPTKVHVIIFNVYGSVHRNNILVYISQQNSHVTEFIFVWRTPPTTHSNQFQIFHESSRQQYGVMVTRYCSYSCFVLLKMGDSETRNM